MGVRGILDRVNMEFRPSKPTTIKQKKPPPKSLAMNDLAKGRELYSVLRPMGDATDKLQSDSLTANLVVLSVATAFRSKFLSYNLINIESSSLFLTKNCVINQDYKI